MDNKLFNKEKMFTNVIGVLDKENSIWGTSLPFKTVYNSFDDYLKLIVAENQKQTSTKSISAKKKQAFNNMIDSTLVVAANAVVYAGLENNDELKVKFDLSSSRLKVGNEGEVYKRCMDIHNEVETIKSALIPDFLTVTQLDELKVLIDGFKDLISAPREVRKESKTAKSVMLKWIAACDELLNEKMDKLMLNYKVSHPDFYLQYTNARVIGGWSRKKNDEKDTTEDPAPDSTPIV